jgi:tetratricopeptide (TPR) repeat protein
LITHSTAEQKPFQMYWNTKMLARRRNPNCFLALILSLLLVAPALGKARTPGRDQQAADRDQDLCAHSLANPDAGIPACTRLIGRDGNGEKSSGFYNNRGVGKVRKDDLESAIRDFTSALDHNPNFVDALKNRGIAFHLLGKYDDAIADFNQALQIDPKATAIYNGRGAALFQKGGINRAIADYNKAIELDPNYTNAYVNRGQAYVSKTQFDLAIADFDAVVRLAPNDPRGYINRGDALASKGEFNGAVNDYDVVVGLDPRNWEAYTHRGEARRLQGDLVRSLADHDKAIALNAKAKEAYTNRALTLKDQALTLKDAGKLEKLDKAAAECDEALLIDPNYLPAYLDRGWIRRLSGDLKGSANDLDKAVSLDRQFPLALSFRGDTRRELGDTEGAVTDFTEALVIWPEFVPAYTGRGLTYEKRGDFPKAKADFEKAKILRPAPDGLAKPAQDVARAHLAALAEAVSALPKEPAGDTAKAEREAAAKAGAELERAKAEAERKAQAATATAEKAIEELQRFKQEAESRAKATPEVVPDPGTRVALVVGNSQYRNVEFLPNPQRDAEAVADTFRKLGFQVLAAQNLTLQQFRSAVDAFEEEAKKGADWAVIYYAGHGLEVGGVNYLVPVDAKLVADKDVKYEAVPLDDLLQAAGKAKKLRLVILDACRNNPFVPRMQKTMASRSIGRGFARVEPEAGTLVAYSAGDGQVAEDGDGEHSPFTQAFLKNVVQPKLEIGMLFRRIYDDVRAATHGNQEPATHYSLPGELFYFATR